MKPDPFSPEFWKAYQKEFQRPEDERFLQPEVWDEMAEDYDDLEACTFYREMVNQVVRTMEAAGALSAETTLLDLCCGTGTYTVRFAPRVREVWALDVSGGMLAVLQRKLKDQGITNVKIVQADWRLYRPPRQFDTVFVSLTPILNDLQEVDRILEVAERYVVFIHWAGIRENELYLEILKQFFGRKPRKRSPGAVVLFNYLFARGYPAEMRFFSGVWERKRSLEREWRRLRVRLENEGISLSPEMESRLKAYLASRAKEGHLYSRTRVRLGFLLADLQREKLAFS